MSVDERGEDWRCPPCGAVNDNASAFCEVCGSPQTTPTRWRPLEAGEVTTVPIQIEMPRYRQPDQPPIRQRGRGAFLAVAVVTLVAAGGFVALALRGFGGPDTPIAAVRGTPSASTTTVLVSIGPAAPAPDPSPVKSVPAPAQAPAPAPAPATATGRTPSPARSPLPPSTSPLTIIGMVDVRAVATDPHVVPVGTLLDRYLTGINAQQYSAVLALFDPAGSINPGNPTQAAGFTSGISTTTDTSAVLLSIVGDVSHAGDLDARMTFRSRQQPGFGPPTRPAETCTRWDITYELRPGGPLGYRILNAARYTDSPC